MSITLRGARSGAGPGTLLLGAARARAVGGGRPGTMGPAGRRRGPPGRGAALGARLLGGAAAAAAAARGEGRAAAPRPAARLLVAPMMDWTDAYYRTLARLLTRHTTLYTEMIVDNTIIHQRGKELDRFLHFPALQHPLVLQLGGSDPRSVALAARIACDGYGYDEINLNCGCPSDKVAGAGTFGAALMKTPELVGDICAAVAGEVAVPVSVKCRIGVDDVDSYAELCGFVRTVSERAGVRTFVVHARKAILKGLSPKDNRRVPTLKRAWVFALAQDFPHLTFHLNGVISGAHEAAAFLAEEVNGAGVAGVMIGRAAYETPWHALADADRAVFGREGNPCAHRRELLDRYAEWADQVLAARAAGSTQYGTVVTVRKLAKPLVGLFYQERGAGNWRRALHDHVPGAASVGELVARAARAVPEEVLLEPPPTAPFAFDPPDSAGEHTPAGRSREEVLAA